MEKSSRILIGAIFILVIALVSFNYGSITGFTVKQTEISITPNPAPSGQKIYVTVDPGPNGVYKRACFYQAEDNLRKGCTYRVCGGSYKCFDVSTFSFSTHAWEPGIHYVKIFDYDLDNYVEKYFTIT